jgi:hypothetical protein
VQLPPSSPAHLPPTFRRLFRERAGLTIPQERIAQSKGSLLHGNLRDYERAQADVLKLKNVYLSKTRKADEAEDEFVHPTAHDPPRWS